MAATFSDNISTFLETYNKLSRQRAMALDGVAAVQSGTRLEDDMLTIALAIAQERNTEPNGLRLSAQRIFPSQTSSRP